MTTKQTIERYLSGVEQRNDWQSLLADDMVFTSYTSPITTDVAEVYSVHNDKIATFGIYFDSAPFPKR